MHHQNVICGVTCDRFSLQRKPRTLQSALLGALHLTFCWHPGKFMLYYLLTEGKSDLSVWGINFAALKLFINS